MFSWGFKRCLKTIEEYQKYSWLVGFYGISTFVGYLMPNPFLYKYSVLFQTIQFSMSTQFVKNSSISSYSIYSNSFNSTNSV